jgi:hypothetical protein
MSANERINAALAIEDVAIGVVDCARCKKPVRKHLARFETHVGLKGSLFLLARCHGTAEEVIIDGASLLAEFIPHMRNVIDVTLFCDRPTFEIRARRSFVEGP